MAITMIEEFNDHRLYRVNLQGNLFTVTVTSFASMARRWLHNVLNEPQNSASLKERKMVVGLGIRWSPNSHPRNHVPNTLQLCVADQCLIFQLSRCAQMVPRNLHEFLKDTSFSCVFVGFRNLYHRHLLYHSNHRLLMSIDPLDLRAFINDEELANGSIQNIVEACLGFHGVGSNVDVAMSDWGAEILSDQQVLDASVEARCAYLIGLRSQVWKCRFCSFTEIRKRLTPFRGL